MAPSPSNTAPPTAKWRALSLEDKTTTASVTPYLIDLPLGVNPLSYFGSPERVKQVMFDELEAQIDAKIATNGPTLEVSPLGATQFHVFGKLPNELKDKILKLAALNTPRRVEIIWKGGSGALGGPGELRERNPPILLRQVNKYFRSKTPKELGYEEIVIPCDVNGKTCTYLYNPQIDLLRIPMKDYTYYQAVTGFLEATGIFKGVETIVIFDFETPRGRATRPQYASEVSAHVFADNSMGGQAGLRPVVQPAQGYPWVPGLSSTNRFICSPLNGTVRSRPVVVNPGTRGSLVPVRLSDSHSLGLEPLITDRGNCLRSDNPSTGTGLVFDAKGQKKKLALGAAATSCGSAFSPRDEGIGIGTDHHSPDGSAGNQGCCKGVKWHGSPCHQHPLDAKVTSG